MDNPQDDEATAAAPAADPETSARATTEMQDTHDADLAGFPLWVRLWLGMQSSGIFLDFFLLTLIGYFGDAETTHDLAATTLASSAAGRLLSLSFPYLPAFDLVPMHTFSAILYSLRVGLWLVPILQLCGILHLSYGILLPLWSTWIVVSQLHNSLTDMTVTAHVSDSKRQTVAQMSVTMSYSALFLGLLTASTLVLSVEGGKLGASASASFLSSPGLMHSFGGLMHSPASFMAQVMSPQ